MLKKKKKSVCSSKRRLEHGGQGGSSEQSSCFQGSDIQYKGIPAGRLGMTHTCIGDPFFRQEDIFPRQEELRKFTIFPASDTSICGQGIEEASAGNNF